LKNKLLLTAKAIAVTAVIALLVLVIIKLWPFVISLTTDEGREAFGEFIDSLGAFGIIAMLLLQTVQIIVAVIPGEPIEILFGMMYGTFGGLLLALFGVAAGQILVFLFIRRFGINFARKFVDVDKFSNLKFLKDPARRESLIFLLFFIPGTPKDILTYFAPFTGIALPRFMIISILARIPSVISSTWAGATLSEGSFVKTAVIFAVTGAVGICGIILNNMITKHQNKSTNEESDT